MSITSWKELLKRNQSSTKKRKIDTKKNYSSYWMDDDKYSRFSGLSSSASASSNVVKLVKLSNYRKAVTNFVKILTNQEIPVKWAGDTSYTDGQSITITTDIKESNFDVTVGLALHEASHVLLTDFTVLPKLFNGYSFNEYTNLMTELSNAQPTGIDSSEMAQTLKSLINWVEDRRIDSYVFGTSPGYKAYYHKMYDHYFNNDKTVIKALGAKNFRDVQNLDHWLFHIINSMNPASDPNALPGLKRVLEIANIKGIKDVKSTHEVVLIAAEMLKEIFANMKSDQQQPQPQQPQPQQPQPQQNKPKGKGSSGQSQKEENEDQEEQPQTPKGGGGESEEQEEDQDDKQSGSGSQSGDSEKQDTDSEASEGEGDEEELPEMTAAEIKQALDTLNKQKQFADSDKRTLGKKSANKQLQRDLEKTEKENIDVQTTESVAGKSWAVLTYDYTKKGMLLNMFDVFSNYNNSRNELGYSTRQWEKVKAELTYNRDLFCGHTTYSESLIQQGLDMGALLGKKLAIRNESRERVDVRLTKGRIDNRRLAHAGYGIESVFNQITVDQYKKANLHVSLDLSGSMNGTNWNNTVRMTAAIAKAITYTQNIEMQVTVRTTKGCNEPVIAYIYDSRINNLATLVAALKMIKPTGMTPEGLCFEAMIKQNKLVKGTAAMDSFFLNISDGEPCCSSYSGAVAHYHTGKQIDAMKGQLGIKVLSFFMTSYESSTLENSSSGRAFKTMYKDGAAIVNPNNALDIAKAFNTKFLSK